MGTMTMEYQPVPADEPDDHPDDPRELIDLRITPDHVFQLARVMTKWGRDRTYFLGYARDGVLSDTLEVEVADGKRLLAGYRVTADGVITVLYDDEPERAFGAIPA